MRRFLVLLAALTLTGCLTTGKRGGDVAMAIYDLGLISERPPEKLPLALAVEVRAPLWLDTMGIDYRLAYADPARLREYARARWAGPPAQLVQQRLIRQFGLPAAGQGRAPCILRFELSEFSQVFDTPESSRGLLLGSLQWLDRGRKQLAERPVNIVVPAGSADARGGVVALTAAVGQLTVAIADWNGELSTSGRLAACQP